MRNILYFIVLTILLISMSAALRSPDDPKYVENEILVKLSPGISSQDADNVFKTVGAHAIQVFPTINVFRLQLKSDVTVDQALKEVRLLSNIVYAEPNYIYSIEVTPNDPNFDRLWAMQNLGQTGGLAGADIEAPQAWDISVGSPAVIVGVVDTGIDYTHVDLAANIFTNPLEDAWANPSDPSSGNGIDDDGNGKIDDWKGWNFYSDNNNPYDDNMHGTHCAGTIGAIGNNGVGVAGVCWQVKLVPLKFLDSRGSGSTSAAIDAILYAADLGVDVLSNSWGGGGYSAALEDAIEYANNKGVLFVAAAGNDGTNNDDLPNYPSNYETINVIAVAASDHSDKLAVWGSDGGDDNNDCGLICSSATAAVPGSNYGRTSVDLAAPGKNIFSTAPGSDYTTLSGTSMATPHVAGAAALLLAVQPNLSVTELKNALLSTVDKLDDFTNKVVTGGRLNIAAAVKSVAPTP
ncbi:MAG: hypothetical protein EHM72_02580 [Calditrichaeota bacterium]|nr:MAG: hypothetical protein EHM72_02580 [Calditrichota bacterium]